MILEINKTQSFQTIDEFVSNGGKIQKCKPGQSGLDTKVRAWDITKARKRNCVTILNSKSTAENTLPCREGQTTLIRRGEHAWPKPDAGKA